MSLSSEELFPRSYSKNVGKLMHKFVADFDIDEDEITLNFSKAMNGCFCCELLN